MLRNVRIGKALISAIFWYHEFSDGTITLAASIGTEV
jgi:hypothetical protein